MPKVSSKQKIINIRKSGLTHVLSEQDICTDDEIEESLVQLIFAIKSAKSCSYGEIQNVPKQHNWLSDVLPLQDEGRFRQLIRLNHSQFNFLLEEIKTHKVFESPKKEQTPVSVQLALVMYRFGCNGSSSSLRNIAALFGLGDGATINRFTRRVIQAILSLKDKYVFWPSAIKRQELECRNNKVRKHCIGYVDGTKCRLSEAPTMDHELYSDKDKNYSLNVQLVCDIDKKIRNFVISYPGSCHDSRIFNECSIQQNLNAYFSGRQYLAADKAYPSSDRVLTPFRTNSNEMTSVVRKKFNKYFSSQRVKIEHTNGILKETFASLKELRIRIYDEKSHREACKWIEAIIIVYNMFPHVDLPGFTDYIKAGDILDDKNEFENPDNEQTEGKRLREDICCWLQQNMLISLN